MNKRFIRKVFLYLVFDAFVILGVTIGLFVYDNYKYNTYKIIPADLIETTKTYVGGVAYYQGKYKYKIDKKEYFYLSPKLYRDSADQIIQIKYNSEDPLDIYNENDSKMYLITIIVCAVLIIFFIVIAVSLTPSKTVLMITAQVIEDVNCVGGRRIYLSDINITDTNIDKYYVCFSKDFNKFRVGNILYFNKFKYGEGITKEDYKGLEAQTLYNFEDDDFSIVKEATK